MATLGGLNYFMITHARDTMILAYDVGGGGCGYFEWRRELLPDSTQQSYGKTTDTIFFKKGNYVIYDSGSTLKGRIVKYKEMTINEEEKNRIINDKDFIEVKLISEKEYIYSEREGIYRDKLGYELW